MSGLMDLLSMAARSLDAQRFGLDVVGQNIANLNTQGYTKRVTELASVPPADRWSGGGGAQIVGARAMRDRLLDRRVREEHSSEQRESAVSEQLGVVEVAIGSAGESLDAALDSFFDVFATLADAPTSSTARQEVVLQGQALGNAFLDIATRLEASRRDLDLEVRSTVDQINVLGERIAGLNAKLSGTSATSPEGASLRDEINRALEDLAGLVDLNAVERPTGGFDIDFAGGHPLVIGDQSYRLDFSDSADGFAGIVSGGDVVTTRVGGGKLGGLLSVRDTNVPRVSGAPGPACLRRGRGGQRAAPFRLRPQWRSWGGLLPAHRGGRRSCIARGDECGVGRQRRDGARRGVGVGHGGGRQHRGPGPGGTEG